MYIFKFKFDDVDISKTMITVKMIVIIPEVSSYLFFFSSFLALPVSRQYLPLTVAVIILYFITLCKWTHSLGTASSIGFLIT